MSNELALRDAINVPALAEQRGIDPQQWSALKTAIFPGASDDMIGVAYDYCKARKLDPLKKPVHIVKVWDSDKRAMVDTIWPSITELRITAMRTGVFAGKDPAEYGPDITERVGSISLTYPEWCQVTVYRLVGGQRMPFPGERVYWKEAYASKKDGSPNAMWTKRARGQIAKCAEAAALRAAFPEELSGQPTAEEMEGQSLHGDAPAVEDRPAPGSGFSQVKPRETTAEPDQPETIDAELVETEADPDSTATEEPDFTEPAATPENFDEGRPYSCKIDTREDDKTDSGKPFSRVTLSGGFSGQTIYVGKLDESFKSESTVTVRLRAGKSNVLIAAIEES